VRNCTFKAYTVDAIVHTYRVKDLESQELADEETIYEIGSITKTVTGLMLSSLIVQGKVKFEKPILLFYSYMIKFIIKVNLWDPVDKFFPMELRDVETGNPMLLMHLGTHTSGLPALPDNIGPDENDPYEDYDRFFTLINEIYIIHNFIIN